MPVSAANSFAVSPLSFHRSTRFAHCSRIAGSCIAASGAESYASITPLSGTRLVERILVDRDRPQRHRERRPRARVAAMMCCEERTVGGIEDAQDALRRP
jgi:hypothetical protein